MHIRARLHRRRLQISLIDTRRVGGKVQQEHIATLGSVPPDMTPADRVAFWTKVHPRLARLGNRFDSATLAKVMGELHAKVPMMAIGDPAAIEQKIGIAEHNISVWTGMRDYVMGLNDDLKGLAASIAEKIAENEKLAAHAAGWIDQDRAKVAKLAAGEDVDVGKEIDFREELLKAGFTEAHLRHCHRLDVVVSAGDITIEGLADHMHEARDRARIALVKRLYNRRVRVRDKIRELLEEPEITDAEADELAQPYLTKPM